MFQEWIYFRKKVKIFAFQDGTLKAEIIKDDYMPLINKAVAEAMAEAAAADKAIPTAPKTTVVSSTVDDTSPVIDFLQGKHCLTGVSITQRYGLNHNSIFIFLAGYWLVEIRILLRSLRPSIPFRQERRDISYAGVFQRCRSQELAQGEPAKASPAGRTANFSDALLPRRYGL